MINLMDRLALVCAKVAEISISDCVHFCGYRYGRKQLNPYEEFAAGLAHGRPLDQVRDEFTEYLQHYRPLDVAQALGIGLSRSYPLWYLPWRTLSRAKAVPGWQKSPDAIIDVMTHFCEEGIPYSGLINEYLWHERAFRAIQTYGYQPETYGYVKVRELRHGGQLAYLVTDGNHRISALSALGKKTVRAVMPIGSRIDGAHAESWPLVKARMVTRSDALLILGAYLSGNHGTVRSIRAAPIVGKPR